MNTFIKVVHCGGFYLPEKTKLLSTANHRK